MIPPSHIKAIDRDYWDPSERATGIHQTIWPAIEALRQEAGDGKPTNWDVLCWASGYLNQMAASLGVDRLLEIAIELNRVVHQIHYSNAPELYGAPDKRRMALLARRNGDGVSVPLPFSAKPYSPISPRGRPLSAHPGHAAPYGVSPMVQPQQEEENDDSLPQEGKALPPSQPGGDDPSGADPAEGGRPR